MHSKRMASSTHSRGGAAIDQVTEEDDPIALGHGEPVEELDGLVVAAVQVADDDHFSHEVSKTHRAENS